jgi:predicted acetyltransferase
LAVQKEFRRLGLAKAMMTQLHRHLQHQGVLFCGLHVRTSNEAACRLYEEDGYEISQRIPSYYQDGEDAYFMKKMLESAAGCSTGSFSGPTTMSWRKVWRSGPAEFRLPRTHTLPGTCDELSSSSDSQSSSSSPELLTGTL